VFTATAPEGIGRDKYDETAGSMIAVLRYGSGLPFNRIENLQKSMDMPLPASTQWEIVRDVAKKISPAYEELVKQAAQGDIIHNDDTTMRILNSVNSDTDRKGVFTTGILSIKEGKKIALFKTGSNHAGENITELLRQRSTALPPPIQMCDGLSRNISKEFETLVANCMAHGRRNFVDLHSIFPEECHHVIEIIANVYKNDDDTKKMSPEERLAFHQVHSGPLMDDLRLWLNEQMDTMKVEPNSSLGKAFSYMLRRWERLTLFLKVPNAPLDNNICEQALKMAIRHRKNSLFYKTHNGAMVGDTFMSLIHTCNLCGANPFDYLNALQRYASELAANPELWMPWNYKDTIRTLTE
jgi:Transposase IS66 family.